MQERQHGRPRRLDLLRAALVLVGRVVTGAEARRAATGARVDQASDRIDSVERVGLVDLVSVPEPAVDGPPPVVVAVAGGRTRLRIAGLEIELIARAFDLPLGVPDASLPFVVADPIGPPDLRVEVDWADLPRPGALGGRPRFDSGGTWRLFEESDGLRYEFATEPVGERCYRVARLGRSLSEGVRVLLHRPYYSSGRPIYPIDHPLDELLMLQLLAERGGAEVHACGFIDDHGGGHLFIGPSGAGKTTIGRLLASAGAGRVLSDDRVVVRFGDHGPALHGTFWHGEGALASPATAPLVRVHFLRQASENRSTPLGIADATARLVSCTFAPFHDAAALGSTVDVVARVAATVPCAELAFRRDPSIAALIRAGGA